MLLTRGGVLARPASAASWHARHQHRVAHRSSQACVVCMAGPKKGFGRTNKKTASDDEDDGPGQRKMKRSKAIKLSPEEQRQQAKNQAFEAAMQTQQSIEDKGLDEDFNARLRQLKAEGEQKKMSASAGGTGSTSVASASVDGGSKGGTATAAPVAAFDAKPEDIYANPPSVTDTIMSQLNSDVSDPSLRQAQFGPNQIAVAGGAIIFGLVFVLVSGVDFSPSNRFQGVRPAQDAPDSVEQGLLKGAITELEQDLAQDPNDTQATEQLALAYARLQDYDKASKILEKLTARIPNDPDAWRLLGETNLLAERSQPAVNAYRRAVQLRDNDMQIATGLTDAYIANGQQANAVEYLLTLRKRAPSITAWGVRATDAPSPSSSSSADSSTDSSSSGSGSSGQSEASSSGSGAQNAASTSRRRPIKPLEPVSIELLLAKTYSSWRGHDSDALATYDDLIKRFPEDFRGYLAKGVFLRDKGRRSDAERMFLQARFYAPESRQRFVQEEAETKPIVDLPSAD